MVSRCYYAAALLLAGLCFKSAEAQFEGDFPPCSVCGDGEVTFASAVVPIPPELADQVPEGFTITCGILDLAGQGGVIPPEECAQLAATAEFAAL